MKYVRNLEICCTQINHEEIALYDPKKDTFWGIEGPFADLWELLSEPVSAERLMLYFKLEYSGVTDDIMEELEDFLQEMLKEGLVKLV